MRVLTIYSNFIFSHVFSPDSGCLPAGGCSHHFYRLVLFRSASQEKVAFAYLFPVRLMLQCIMYKVVEIIFTTFYLQENIDLISSRHLQIFSFFKFVIRIGFHVFVTTLLIHSLGVEQITHGTCSSLVIISV